MKNDGMNRVEDGFDNLRCQSNCRMKAERTNKLPHLSIQMHVGKGVSVDS